MGTAPSTYVLHSLLHFRLRSFRHYVHLLAERCAEQPYRAVFEAAADATPRTDAEDWQRNAPDDYQAFLRERQRLLGEKRPYDVALAEAQAQVRAARRARGLR